MDDLGNFHDVTTDSSPINVTAGYLMSYESYMALGTYLLVTGVFGAAGNGLVVVMFARDKGLTTSVDLLLLNLAVADLCMCLFCFPFVSASNFAQHWLFGELGCTLYGFFGFLFGNAGICSLCAISVQRYLVVCRHYSNKRDTMTVIIIFVVWIVALIWSGFPLLLPEPYTLEPFGTSCTVAWATNESSTRVFIYSLVSWVILQVIVFTGCYAGIFLKSRKEVMTTSSRTYQDLLVSKICLVLVVAFIVCWAPYVVFSLWYSSTATTLPLIVTALPVMFAKVSACINPLLYIIISSRFRQKYLSLFTCCAAASVPAATTATPATSVLTSEVHPCSTII